ncbi:MAG: hypothetical protein H6729_10560 [Deltaproteobacteria bacterium]|nr:hypothetical protein [Deltaproteobacteria bacterium]
MTRTLSVVLGRDVSRSLSPMLHQAAATRCGVDLAYVPVSCADEAHFHRVLDALMTIGACGANVTIPYKRLALARSHRVSEAAAEMGAVNTLTFGRAGEIAGDNTDGPGLLRLFDDLPDARFACVQLLGAGGVARAVGWALARRGVRAEQIHVCARRPAQAEAVAAHVGSGAGATAFQRIRGATLVLSGLPSDPSLAERAMTEWVDTAARPMIYDLGYQRDARETPLTARARAAGLEAVDGRALLVEQAALSFALWTGSEAAVVRNAMQEAMSDAVRALP